MTPKEQYERDGYVVAKALLSADQCTELKAETQRIIEQHGDHGGVFVGLAANSALFRQTARHPRILDAIEALIGPNIEFVSDKVVYKSAEKSFGSPWHQDWPYWKGAHKLSVWIALDPASPANGCLKLLPGSHRSVVGHDVTDVAGEGFTFRLDPDDVDEAAAVAVECDSGDAVIFHDLTLHASFPNRSGKDRSALISTYRSAAVPDIQYEWAVAAEVVRGSREG